MGIHHSSRSTPLAVQTSTAKKVRDPAPQTSPVEIPQRILVYANMADILEKSALGKGTFGSVVLIDEKSECDPSNIRKVAMKKPCKEPEHSTIKNERFMLSNLDHPNIIKLFGFAVPSISENNPTSSAYQLCEYCTGGELFHIISTHGPLEEDVARNYFFQLMLALNYLHTTARVVHRDLKPENILVDLRGGK